MFLLFHFISTWIIDVTGAYYKKNCWFLLVGIALWSSSSLSSASIHKLHNAFALTERMIQEFIHDYHICLIAIFNLLLKLISNLKESHMNI